MLKSFNVTVLSPFNLVVTFLVSLVFCPFDLLAELRSPKCRTEGGLGKIHCGLVCWSKDAARWKSICPGWAKCCMLLYPTVTFNRSKPIYLPRVLKPSLGEGF